MERHGRPGLSRLRGGRSAIRGLQWLQYTPAAAPGRTHKPPHPSHTFKSLRKYSMFVSPSFAGTRLSPRSISGFCALPVPALWPVSRKGRLRLHENPACWKGVQGLPREGSRRFVRTACGVFVRCLGCPNVKTGKYQVNRENYGENTRKS
jgi:hypothetical protein